MNVGILGLGLIGGSLARAYSKAGHTVYVHDTDASMLSFAQLAGYISGPLKKDNIRQCDLILLAVYAGGSIDWIQQNADTISPNAFVID